MQLEALQIPSVARALGVRALISNFASEHRLGLAAVIAPGSAGSTPGSVCFCAWRETRCCVRASKRQINSAVKFENHLLLEVPCNFNVRSCGMNIQR